MDRISILNEIEAKYPVEDLRIGNIQLWPFLRTYLGQKLILAKDYRKKLNLMILWDYMGSWYYGFWNLFRSYDYIIMSVSNNRKRIGDQYIDPCDIVAEHLGKALYFELPNPSHYKRSQIPTRYIVTKYHLYVLEMLFARIFYRRTSIMHEYILKEAIAEFKLDFEYRTLALRLLGQYRTMKLLIWLYRPKALVLITPYTNMGYVKACSDTGVKVIEIQHGTITKGHRAYNISKVYDKGFFPDYLLTFGELEKKVFTSDNHYIDPEYVIPIGNFYVDYIASRPMEEEKLQDRRKDHRYIIGISIQDPYEKELMQFMKEVYEKDDKDLFIFMPRAKPVSYYQKLEFPPNVIFLKDLDTYQIIRLSDFHSTMTSTTALEAPSLGAQNIMINIEDRSRKLFKDHLYDSSITRYANSPQEYLEILAEFPRLDPKEVMHSNERIIVPKFKSRLKKGLIEILGDGV